MPSLFPYPDIYISEFKKRFLIELSKEFVSCADQQLTNSFELQTGLKPNKRIEIGWAYEPVFSYASGEISKFAAELWVNNKNNPITVAWRSLSGKVYQLTDTSIDCNDIRFWLENIDPVLYSRQLYPKITIPFGIKDLSYQLIIERINTDMTVEMQLKRDMAVNAGELTKKIDGFLNDYNILSEKKNRSNGVIHKWKSNFQDNVLTYDIDLGSGGFLAVKKMIGFLSTLNSFDEVKFS